MEIRRQRVAIEVELSEKLSWRLATILYELARTEAGHLVFLPPATRALLQRAIAELSPPTIRQKFSLVPLRLEGQLARRPTVSPAPPTERPD